MDLWIRSQDKMKLIKINNVYITFGNNTKEYAIVYDEQNGIEVLGTYKTKERALEVLDEIQKLDIGNNLNIETVCYAFNLLKVTYNMPKE